MRNVARATAAAAVSALLVGMLPGQALAAEPGNTTSTFPVADSTVDSLTQVKVVFDQPLLDGSITVDAPTGTTDFSCTQSAFSPLEDHVQCTPARAGGAAFADGTYTVKLTAVLLSAPDEELDEQYVFTLDTTGPSTSVAVSPAPYPAAKAGTPVTVSGKTDPGSSVLVSLASSGATAAQPNPTAKTLTANGSGDFSTTFPATIADGTLTAVAVARDALGNAGPQASATTLKDLVLPSLSGSVPAEGASEKAQGANNAINGITLTASEALDQAKSTVALAKGATPVAPAATVTFPTATSIKATPTAALAEGTYTATASLVDLAGNTTAVTRTFVIDDTAPASPVFTPGVINIANKAGYALSGTGEAGAALAAAIGTVNGTSTVGSGGAWALTKDVSALSDGPVAISVTQTDAAGNTSVAGQKTTTKDTVAPVAPVLGTVPTQVTSANQAAVTVTGDAKEAGAKVLVTVTNGTGSVTGTATSAANGTFSAAVDVTKLADGTLTVVASSTDAAGNPGPDSATALTTPKDATAPTVSLLAATATSYGHLLSTVTGKSSEAGTVALKATDGTSTVTKTVTLAADKSFTATLDLGAFKTGSVTVTAVATDVVGNVGRAATAATTHDAATPPGLPAAPKALAGDRSAKVFVTAPATNGAPISYYVVQALVGGTVVRTATGATSPVTVTGLANGVDHVFRVQAVNRAGAGPLSPLSEAAMPLGVTRTTLAATPTAVVAGSSITLKGTVSRSDTSAPFDAVYVFVERAGLPLKLVDFATPSSTGAWSLKVRPSYTGVYTAVYGGDEVNDLSFSASRRTAVRFRVTVSAPTGSHLVNQVVTGRVGPTAAGRVAYLYKVRADGSVVKLAAAKVSSTGTYRFSVRLPKGSTKLRVVVPGTARNAAGKASVTANRT